MILELDAPSAARVARAHDTYAKALERLANDFQERVARETQKFVQDRVAASRDLTGAILSVVEETGGTKPETVKSWGYDPVKQKLNVVVIEEIKK